MVPAVRDYWNSHGVVAVLATPVVHAPGRCDHCLRDPLVIVMEAAEEWGPDNLSADQRDRPRLGGSRHLLVSTLMRSGTIEVVLHVLLENTT